MIKVLKPGLATSVQDLGREGYYHLGIPPSGALDQYALSAANQLVGNPAGAAALECTLLGPELEFQQDALVAVSQGLLERFSRDEVRAVLAHEIGHVANGDMVTLALVQGVVNTFVMFFARIFGNFVDRVILKNEGEGHGIGYIVATIFAELVLGFLASAIVMWFSRKREFRADEAGAQLAGTSAMISALQRLRSEQGLPVHMPDTMAAFGINGGLKQGLARMFMSHPPLEERIDALRRRG